MCSLVLRSYLTKLDILNDFDPIKANVSYKLEDGTVTDQLPYDLVNVKVDPVYEDHDGWKQDISKVKKIEDLPENAKKYVKNLEKSLETPISFVSVGPERSALIIRK